MDWIHNTFGRGKGVTMFTRGQGFWSSTKGETETNWFKKLSEPESQRENWYKITPYISEFWCAVSNIGFIYVGLKHRCPEIVIAGVASFAYHTCPRQWLLHMDRLGVLIALSKFAREYAVVEEHPNLLILPVLAGAINLLDVYMGQYHGQSWFHAFWHLSAALMADRFLSYM